MADDFRNLSSGWQSPAQNAVAVTPNDSTDLTGECRALYVGGAGDLVLILKNDTAAVTFSSVPAGTLLPLRVARVKATNTTATNIVQLY